MANDYTSLNAQLNLIGADGKIQFDKDREAAREYHLQHVNQNTVFFHDLKEKLDYLVENDYYEPELIEQYGFDFVKSMFKRAYGYKYRFETFMGAYKFYTSYALKTNSGDRYLERFEDRVVMTSLLLGGGDREQVAKVLDSIITGRYQPATPTFLNAGRKQRGDYVSCFPGDALVHTEDGHRRIDEIVAGDRVYGHDGQLHRVRNVVVNDNDSRAVAVAHAGAVEPAVLTGNHPVLVHRTRKLKPVVHIHGDGADSANDLYWVSANMILPGDEIAQPKSFHRGLEGDATSVAAVRITDYHLHSVTGVEEAVIPGDKVYNLEVENAKTYVVNDMIVHNCYLLRVEDNMESISRTVTNVLQLSKRGGGVGINLSNLRENGAPIKKIENQCSGVVPVMKILENSFSYANQLGARPGAGVVYLSVHHPDIQLFLDTKKENADEKIRIKTLSLGVVVPDITFHLARSNDKMALFSPYDVEKAYGKPFSDISITELYDEMVANDAIKKKWVSARDVLQRIAEIQFESGYPYILFEDNANREHPIRNMGRINMSNLCVTGDTRLLTDKGYRRMDELWTEGGELSIGDSFTGTLDVVSDNRFLSGDAKATGVSRKSATPVVRTAQNAEVFELSTSDGRTIRATAWHKFAVRRDGTIHMVPLNEIIPGDKLLVNAFEEELESTNSESDLAFLSGVIAADGTYAKTRAGGFEPKLYLYGGKKEFADEIESKIARVLANKHLSAVHHSTTLTPSFTVPAAEDSPRCLHSAPLGGILRSFGVDRDTKLKVPNFVWGGDRKTQEAFIDGLFRFDGTVGGNVEKSAFSIELTSTSNAFLKELQLLLSTMGITTHVYAQNAGGMNILPDGKGGLGEYETNPTWSLRTTNIRNSRRLGSMVSWKSDVQARFDLLSEGLSEGYNTDGYTTVSSIEFSGVEDVYDVEVPDGHTIILDTFVTSNCSEIAQYNTPSEYAEDGSYSAPGQDISCNLGSMNIARAFESGHLGDTVETAVRALTEVSDISDMRAVPSVKNGNESSHSIGLGQMNLAGFLGKHEIFYGSADALDFVNAYFGTVLYHALKTSNAIAEEKDETFEGFDGSDYSARRGEPYGPFFDRYVSGEFDTVPSRPKIVALFEEYGVEAITPDRWEALARRIARTGIYNAYLQAIPPTGSISYINHSTSSIHPIVAKVEIRKEGQIGRVYYPAYGLSDENLDYYEDAYEVGYEKLIDTYAAAQRHVDQALSLTTFMPDTITTRTLNKMYIYAWRKGIKTLYYVRFRQQALQGTAVNECVSCMV